jgi:hypothetical protein
MTRRMFPNDPPRITFTKDFGVHVHGDLKPGRTVTLLYDAERLPHERSTHNGQKDWTIQACYKFEEQGRVRAMDLWSETGTILHKVSNEIGEGTMMTGRIDLPDDADHLTLWFLNTGGSGAIYWDSNYGRNYIFRFIVEDLHVESVEVVSDGKAPFSRFKIEMMALPEVTDLTVEYRIMNDRALQVDQKLPLVPGPLNDKGERPWSGQAAVPENAVVRFTLFYNAYDYSHTDTNSGNGYLTWTGATRNIEAGVL